MLSAVLNSPRAVSMSIVVVNAFVRLRELMTTQRDIAERVEKLERSQERTASVIEILVEDIDQLARKIDEASQSPASTRRIGYLPAED